MIEKIEKRAKYSDDVKKKKRQDANLELAKHANKSLKDLTEKQKDDLLIALGIFGKNGKILS